jgi:hypothetical protein
MGCVKLGQPVPLSNFVVELKSGRRHAAQINVPTLFSLLRLFEKERSVALSNSTEYCSGGRISFHSECDLVSLSIGFGSGLDIAFS